MDSKKSGNNRIRVALFNETEDMRVKAEKLDRSRYEIVAENEQFDIVMIPYENFREARARISADLNIPQDAIYTYEELRVLGCEKEITDKYHALWESENKADILPFKNKTVLIIGGGSGIGRECVLAFERAGANVVIAGRNLKKLQDVKRLYEMRGGERVKCFQWDISKEINKNAEKINAIEQLFHVPIDVVINSAGVLSRETFFEVQEETWDRVMDTNIKGMFFVCQAFAKYFIEKQIRGHMVNVLSNIGALPTVKPYGISKWGGIGLTKGLGMHLAEYGITVNGIAPGGVATEMVDFHPGDCPARRAPKTGRVAFPCEIAHIIRQLAGFTGDNMPGEVVVCDGGDKAITWMI